AGQHSTPGNGHQLVKQLRTFAYRLGQVVTAEHFLYDAVKVQVAALTPDSLQALADDATGNISPLYFFGSQFVQIASNNDLVQVPGKRAVCFLDLQVVDRLEQIILFVGRGHLFGLEQVVPGQSLYLSVEEVTGEREQTHDRRSRGTVFLH